ncbi:MAG: PEP-CTERM sorting domain-containing protein, partial [Opitutales bacterium]|nr:PEP-CTERM sorting domain-containing protein [Opitutales bacterium]
VEDSTFYGRINTRNGASATFTNSTFNFASGGQSIGMNNRGSITFDNSTINAYYTGWNDSDSASAGWAGNVLFLGLGENTDSTITFKNGTIVNGVGLADGTGFWDLTPEQYSDISGGGNVNLGWNKFTSDSDVFTLNLESGSKFSAWTLEFANASACTSEYGYVIWNQGGTDMESGYTESFFVGDVNVRMGTTYFEEGYFGSWLNLLGYTSIYSNSNLNIGNNEAASGYAAFTMTGPNNTANFNNVFFNSGNNTPQSSGEATFDMDANTTGSTFYVRNNWESYIGVGATHYININGENNVFYVTNNFNLTNKTLVDCNTVRFSMRGEGNVLSVNNFITSNGGTQDSAEGGYIRATFDGSNAANKNHVYIRSGEMILQGSQALDSTMLIEYLFKGNTTLSNGDGKGVWLKVNEWGGKQYTSNVLFEVYGSGNELLLSGLEIGKDTPNWDDGYGKGIFRIVGGGSEIILQNFDDGHNGFRLNSGGLLEYVVEDSGITAITNRTWQNTSINGMLKVDFTSITTEQEETRYVLYQTTDKSLDQPGRMADNWFDFLDPDNLVANDDFIEVVLADPTSDTYRFALEEEEIGDYSYQQLVIYFSNSTVIPEPSTYAAIFGALALAFAACRRRK